MDYPRSTDPYNRKIVYDGSHDFSAALVSGLVEFGSGTPENSFAAPPGTWYFDTSGKVAYLKETGNGTSGWQQVGGTAAWTPANLSLDLLDLWFEPSMLAPLNAGGAVAADAEKVATIRDLLGNYNAEQSNAGLQGFYRASSTYNLKPCIDFADASYYRNSVYPGFAAREGQTTIAAFRCRQPDNFLLFSAYSISNQDWGTYVTGAKNAYIGSANYSQANTAQAKASLGMLLTAYHNGQLAGNNRYQLRINKQIAPLTVFSAAPPVRTPNVGAGIQTGFTIGGGTYTSEKFDGELFALIRLKQSPTTYELALIENYLWQKYFAAINDKYLIVCAGDSLTEGYPLQLPPSNSVKNWTYLLGQKLGANVYDAAATLVGTYDFNRKFIVKNQGSRGDSYPNFNNRAVSQIDQVRDGIYKENIVVAWCGTNDLVTVNSATMQANVTNYCNVRRTAGSKVAVCTITDRKDIAGATYTTYTNERNSFNNWLRANWLTIADALVDIDADDRMQDANNATYYYNGDKVHFSDTGCQVVADIVYNAIAALIV